MKQFNYSRWLPWIAVVLTIGYFGYYMRPLRDGADAWHYHAFGRLPVIEGGRYKPMDTYARTNLMVITHRQTYYDYEKEVRHPATEWLLEVQGTPPPGSLIKNLTPNGEREMPAWDHKVFRIENDQLIKILGLKMREGLRYSINEIRPKIDVLVAEAQRARALDPKKVTLFDAKVVELWSHLNLYIQISSHQSPLVVPDPNGTDQWTSFSQFLDEFVQKGGQVGQDVDARTFTVYAKLLALHDQKDKVEFNRLLDEHLAELDRTSPALMRKIDFEIFFNEFAPFYHCLEVYVVIALLGALSWLSVSWSQPLRRAAFAMMAVTFLFHLSGLITRMILQDRLFVFVTNLYSSAVFIGLGCVLGCLICEWFFKNGIALVVGSVTAFCTLIIAHMLSLSGDTMEMMQAVLDTNFWLATHVTCITLGYTTTFVAGFMGIAYILLGVFTNMLRKEGSANLARMTYGVLCTGMFLSFVGTVLGGLWADYSWGRFWGWDPKENGALLIVIWIAMILHARWGGMVKHRGIAVLSVLGIIVTSWSWFGTNFLGVGLHSYGFRAGAMTTLVSIDLGFAAIAGLGAFLPLHLWQSFRPPSSQPASPPSQPGLAARPTMA